MSDYGDAFAKAIWYHVIGAFILGVIITVIITWR